MLDQAALDAAVAAAITPLTRRIDELTEALATQESTTRELIAELIAVRDAAPALPAATPPRPWWRRALPG